ncbi:MAG TPA: efflux RND transporter periplasmic adaptor subunit [Myxococcaceae bacterium]|nr:efflux RND transporter periplasmic adaptor subunit [Myxococcaceae bacterium]
MKRFVILVLLLSACSGGHPPAAPELPAAKVQLLPAGEIGERTWVPATVSAVDHAVLATRVSARVAELTVNEGARVRRGDVLVRLSDDDVRATVKAAESQRGVAESQVRRIEALRAASAATASELDAAMTARADAVARVETARATLADTVLRAPFDAVVQRKWVSRGALVGPGAPLVELDGTSLELTGTLSEPEAAGLAVGAEVPFRVGTVAGTATLVALSTGGDALSHRSGFRARPAKDAPALRSGDFGRIGLTGGGGPRRAVPRAAVVQRGDLSGVFVLADGRAALRWLRFGEPEGDQLPVLAGLTPGDRVIAVPANLRDGQRVEVAGD